jgi:HK97 gp10 family phage protein
VAGKVRMTKTPRALRVALSAETRTARHRLGEDILRDAAPHVPYAPEHNDARGEHLRDSGFVDSDDELTRVGYGQFYGRFLELGTTRISARPFLRPAALKVRKPS